MSEGEQSRLYKASSTFHVKSAEKSPSESQTSIQSARTALKTLTHNGEICPRCGSQRLWRDGGDKGRQRLLCRDCSYRFTENGSSSSTRNLKILNIDPSKGFNRQVCDILQESKNLAAVETQNGKTAGGTTDSATTKGLIIQFMAWLENEGRGNTTYVKIVKLLARMGADLRDPETVKSVVARAPWKNGTKLLAVYAYDAMTEMLKVQWTKPKYKQEESLPFVPEESEIDQLIASCRSQRLMTFLQTLKETWTDPGEILQLRWTDITRNTISVRPVKGHNPRQLEISNKLVTMLNSLPKISDLVFPASYASMHRGLAATRKRAAQLLDNPRLAKISFKSMRHWGGSMLAHYTHGNVILIQRLLGHKDIKNSLKYIHLIQFKDDEFEVATATTLEEDKQLLSLGFDYITERQGIKVYKRPKRFRSVELKPRT